MTDCYFKHTSRQNQTRERTEKRKQKKNESKAAMSQIVNTKLWTVLSSRHFTPPTTIVLTESSLCINNIQLFLFSTFVPYGVRLKKLSLLNDIYFQAGRIPNKRTVSFLSRKNSMR